MDKREAIDALAKFGYDRILVEDEFITQTDGTHRGCPCWGESYQGIAPMHLLEMVAQKYSVYSNKFGRGSAYREKIQKLKELIYGEPIGN